MNNLNLIDTHAHVQFAGFKEDADAVMRRALDNGIIVINVGTQIDTSKYAVQMLEKYPERVYAVIGLHPVHTWQHHMKEMDENELDFHTRQEDFDYEAYKKLAENPKVVGIGECGLDYYRLPLEGKPHEAVFPSNGSVLTEPSSLSESFSQSEVNSPLLNIIEIKALQKKAFEQQIQLALEMNKALVIHCRPSAGTNDAYEDILEILKEVLIAHPDLRFEIHSFTGDLETAKKFIDLGGYIGLNGIITFDKTGKLEEVVKGIPLESIVLETDAPYLAPTPVRGKRNEPLYLEHTARKIAEWKNMSFEDVARVTIENAKKLFKL